MFASNMCLIKFILFNIVINFNLIDTKQNHNNYSKESESLVNLSDILSSQTSLTSDENAINISLNSNQNISEESDSDSYDLQNGNQLEDQTNDYNDLDSNYNYNEEIGVKPNQLIANHLVDPLFDYISDTKSDHLFHNSSNNQTFKVFDKLFRLYDNILNFLKPIQLKSSQRLFELIYSTKLSEQCLAALITTSTALNSKKLWAFKMLDSIGKIPSGLADGVFTSLGEYDECLNIESDFNTENVGVFGKYCLVKPLIPIKLIESFIFEENSNQSNDRIPEYFKQIEKLIKNKRNQIKLILAFDNSASKSDFEIFRFGICIPSKCFADEIEKAFNEIFRSKTGLSFSIGPECHSKVETKRLNIFQLIAWLTLSLLFILVVISTIIELCHPFDATKNPNTTRNQNLWISFSVIKNTKSLFEQKLNRISSADSILLIYILWVFIARSYLSPLYIGAIGLKNVFTSIPNHLMSDTNYFWVRTPFPNETIITISCFIISYNYFGYSKITHNFTNYLNFCLLRWIKLSRRLVGPILLVYILSGTGSGPLWSDLKPQFKNACETHFLRSILLFNNYFEDFDQLCNSSYLAPVFQLQIIAPLFLLVLRKSRRIGYILFLNLIIFGIFAAISPKIFSDQKIVPFEVSAINSLSQIKRSIIRYTQYTDQYIISFAMGSLLGYAVRKQSDLKMTKLATFILWLICPIISLIGVVWAETFIYFNQNVDQKQLNLMSSYSLGKVMWNIGIVWSIYACSTGRGGIITKIMDSEILRPISRLSITFLVLHSIVINYRMFTQKDVFVMTHTSTIQKMITDFVLSVGLSFVFHILIEEPINNFISFKCKQCFKKNKKEDILLKTQNNVVLKYIFPRDNNF